MAKKWQCVNSAHLHRLIEASTSILCGYSGVVTEKTTLYVLLMDINSDVCSLDRFQNTLKGYICTVFVVHTKCIHSVTLTLLRALFVHYAAFNCPHITFSTRFSVYREANLGYVTQCGRVLPLCSDTALCFPQPLLKHMGLERA